MSVLEVGKHQTAELPDSLKAAREGRFQLFVYNLLDPKANDFSCILAVLVSANKTTEIQGPRLFGKNGVMSG